MPDDEGATGSGTPAPLRKKKMESGSQCPPARLPFFFVWLVGESFSFGLNYRLCPVWDFFGIALIEFSVNCSI
jgi:hypothetical protein